MYHSNSGILGSVCDCNRTSFPKNVSLSLYQTERRVVTTVMVPIPEAEGNKGPLIRQCQAPIYLDFLHQSSVEITPYKK